MMANASNAFVVEAAMVMAETYQEQSPPSSIIAVTNLMYLPLLILFGVFGNIMSIMVIFSSNLRFIPPNPYLAYLCASDTAFLVSIIPVWFSLMQTTNDERGTVSLFVCRAHLYVMNCASWLSSWIITALTLERFAVVTQRSRLGKSSAERARWVTAAILPLPLVFNSYVFFWVGVTPDGVCDILPNYFTHGLALNVADTVMVFLLPLLVNLIANGSVFVRLWKGRSPVTRLIVRNTQSSLRRHMKTDHVARQRHQLTKILIIVPMVFLALNLPSYVLRIYHFIIMFTGHVEGLEEAEPLSPLAAAISEIALLLNYTNFGINFIVYCLASRSFRMTPSKLLRGRATWLGVTLRSNQNSFSHRPQSARPSSGYCGEPASDAEPMCAPTRPRNRPPVAANYELLTTAPSCTRSNSPRHSNTLSELTAASTAITNV
uniref:G-protein coupled receptors family 1 profile domain-containing protein n=1 Tax=Plectus sambesii TaxID=2011161 RepID=A0A914XB15_9BILA